MPVAVLPLLVVLLLVLAPAAVAQRAEITQELFDLAGLPQLTANPVPDGGQGAVEAWRACAPDAPCTPLAVQGEDVRSIRPGDVPAGTAFEVDVRAADGTLTTARSLPWGGRVTSTTPPRVRGTARAGRTLRPVPATWTGGWPGDRDVLRLEACPDATGRRGCETVAAQEAGPATCPRAGAVLGRRHVGWFVRAVDQRVAADTVFAGVGYARARDVPVARVSRTVLRSELVGPVAAPRGPWAECARPVVRVLPRAAVRYGRRVLGRVTCTTGCDVELRVRDARRTIRARVDPGTDGAVGLPLGTRLRGRTAAVQVRVNGRLRGMRTVRLR